MVAVVLLALPAALVLAATIWAALDPAIWGNWTPLLFVAFVLLNAAGLRRSQGALVQGIWSRLGWWSGAAGGACMAVLPSAGIWWPLVWRDNSLTGIIAGFAVIGWILEAAFVAAATFLLFGWAALLLSRRRAKRPG